MSPDARHLPLRVWLGLALVAIVVIPVLTAWGILTWQHGQQQAEPETVTAAQRFLAANGARWSDPRWQATARTTLAALGVQVRLNAANDHTVFTTMPLVPQPGQRVEKIPIPNPDPKKGALGTAVLLFPQASDLQASGQTWMVPLIGGLLAVLLTLAGVAWFLGRTVLRPLAAMSQAAQGITLGHFAVRVPASQIQEVTQVAVALETMCAELGAALQRQTMLEQERRLLIGALAHDLRTPLFALRGYLEGLEAGVATTPEKATRYIAVCREKADALERLIADLFAYTRLEYLEQGPQQEPLALDALLRQLVEDMQPLVAVKGVTLTTEGWPVPCPLVGDGHLLARAVQNLLDNALRHTPADGCISVQWRQEGMRLVITVADTGLGIALHDLPHLFTPLYRGEASRNRRTGGAGLGLTIAQRIFQAHGGDLVAANQEAGGAIFTATLPVGGRSREPVAAALGDRSAGRGADRGDTTRP